MCLFCNSPTRTRLRRRDEPKPATIAERVAGNADVIFRGGKIVTMHGDSGVATGLAQREGLVQAVGPVEDIMLRKGRMTRIIELDGCVVVPGFVRADLVKTPVDLIDWQMIDLTNVADAAAYVSATMLPPMFNESVLVEVSGPLSAVALKTMLLVAGNAPLAVRVTGEPSGYVNERMRARIGADPDASHHNGLTAVTDLGRLLNDCDLNWDYSVAGIARFFQRQMHASARQGFTTIVDPALGVFAGQMEFDAALQVAGLKPSARLHCFAHARLRQEWDRSVHFDPEDVKLTIDRAAVDLLHEDDDAAMRDARSLYDAGMAVLFNATSSASAAQAIAFLRRIEADRPGSARAHLLEIGGEIDPETRTAVAELGLATRLNDGAPAGDFHSAISALTREPAHRRGIADMAGEIAIGRAADLAILKDLAPEGQTFVVESTWLEGVQVWRDGG